MSEIKGYKILTDEQKSHVNAVKDAEQQLLMLMKSYTGEPAMGYKLDMRWFSIARTHFEQGFMAMCRAITQPDTVEF